MLIEHGYCVSRVPENVSDPLEEGFMPHNSLLQHMITGASRYRHFKNIADPGVILQIVAHHKPLLNYANYN